MTHTEHPAPGRTVHVAAFVGDSSSFDWFYAKADASARAEEMRNDASEAPCTVYEFEWICRGGDPTLDIDNAYDTWPALADRDNGKG